MEPCGTKLYSCLLNWQPWCQFRLLMNVHFWAFLISSLASREHLVLMLKRLTNSTSFCFSVSPLASLFLRVYRPYYHLLAPFTDVLIIAILKGILATIARHTIKLKNMPKFHGHITTHQIVTSIMLQTTLKLIMSLHQSPKYNERLFIIFVLLDYVACRPQTYSLVLSVMLDERLNVKTASTIATLRWSLSLDASSQASFDQIRNPLFFENVFDEWIYCWMMRSNHTQKSVMPSLYWIVHIWKIDL
jgi:hypothetical protein